MEDTIFEEFEVLKINRGDIGYALEKVSKPVIFEVTLKIYVNNMEIASLICLNQQQEELAIGFLYSEGVINSFEDIEEYYYHERAIAVIVTLKEGISFKRQESLRSITAGCGKCFTYINPLKQSQFRKAERSRKFSLKEIMDRMKYFTGKSDVYRLIGGVHSLLFYTPQDSVFSEDIGRHNCFDKVAGALLKEGKMALAEDGIVFISGRVTSEIMTKCIRFGAPVIVSKSTPSATAVKLANQYNITLLGYAISDSGYIYSGSERFFEVSLQTANSL
ncbi:Sulfur carrier protein FdhD [Sporomusa silvacetica DSM 10669]|uniref:Sulfur carrier protein FdhD n=1 Tax=Sporomusa silvacetica DSM 10669 TaxID=1123289 RepID=A0ABZ3IPY4_9FIRM|nr:formate dehydrogenase accessory sulfurtransferase FdhD [Sporomusa silvacetica]OZC16289.1 protein FdhD [Sporomusa silvacetica DSM 10669]